MWCEEMVKPPRGLRHRTKKLLRKRVRERGGVPPLSRIMIEYRVGDRVYIVADPAVHKAMPHRRYHGKVGVVVGKRGRAYEVEVRVGGKDKKLFLLPEHMRPAFQVSERVESMVKRLRELAQLSKKARKLMLEALRKSGG